MAHPIVFGDCFGWYHPGSGDLGVVLCGPHGYEELCVHRHWRTMAQRLADAGLPTIRFDYPGSGDSVGGESDENSASVAQWIDSIDDAVARLRALSGVERVALVGLRLGGLLASIAADRGASIAALVLLAPIESGEEAVRELRALARMRAPARHRSALEATPDGALEPAGFLYRHETLRDLAALKVAPCERKLADSLLILDRPAARHDADFQRRLTATQDRSQGVFEDYTSLLRDADAATYPAEGFGAAIDWLRQRSAPAARPHPVVPAAATLCLPAALETPLLFHRLPDLFGIVCTPRPPGAMPADRPTIILLNTGANHHIGPGGMTVTLARRLAALGYASFRFDVGGVGDSEAPAGRTRNHPSNADTLADVRLALDWLEAHGHARFVMLGLCSGAKLALEATLADRRVIGQVLLNLQGYWRASDVADQFASRRTYLRLVGRASSWKQALRGEIDVVGVARSMLARTAESVAHEVSEQWSRLRRRGGPRATRLDEFRRLAVRHVKTCLIYGDEDPGVDELELVFGRNGHALATAPNIAIAFLSDGDHVFSSYAARRQLFAAIEGQLLRMDRGENSASPTLAETAGASSTSRFAIETRAQG